MRMDAAAGPTHPWQHHLLSHTAILATFCTMFLSRAGGPLKIDSALWMTAILRGEYKRNCAYENVHWAGDGGRHSNLH